MPVSSGLECRGAEQLNHAVGPHVSGNRRNGPLDWKPFFTVLFTIICDLGWKGIPLRKGGLDEAYLSQTRQMRNDFEW